MVFVRFHLSGKNNFVLKTLSTTRHGQRSKATATAQTTDGQQGISSHVVPDALHGSLLFGRNYWPCAGLGRCHCAARRGAVRLFLAANRQERSANSGRAQQLAARRAAGHDSVLCGRHNRHIPPRQQAEHGNDSGLCRWRCGGY